MHAHDFAKNGATTIDVYSPDTDVLVLLIRRYPRLCRYTNLITGVGLRQRNVCVGDIYQSLGESKATALPGLHAISGADNTGSFMGKGKMAFWKCFQSANLETINALINLGAEAMLAEETLVAIEGFTCKIYTPKTTITDVSKLRWFLFSKKQLQSSKLPPTRDALRQAIFRAHCQSLVWNSDPTVTPTLNE